jgi:hypothetical protein
MNNQLLLVINLILQGVRLQYQPNWMIAEHQGSEILKLISAVDSSKVYVSFDSAGPDPEVIAPDTRSNSL